MSALTTNRYQTSTGERIATVRITLHLSAEELAVVLADDIRDYEFDDDGRMVPDLDSVDLSADAIRGAVKMAALTGIETASYRVGDNYDASVVETLTTKVVAEHFDGRQYISTTNTEGN